MISLDPEDPFSGTYFWLCSQLSHHMLKFWYWYQMAYLNQNLNNHLYRRGACVLNMVAPINDM